MKKTRGYHAYTEYDREPAGLKRLDFIVESIRKYSGSGDTSLSVLDIGCGNGNISIPLASLGYRILGIDTNAASIEYATKKNPFLNVSFKIADIAVLEVDEKFDVIICSEVLEHLNEPHEALLSIKRMLKPSGLLIVTIPNGYGSFGLMELLVRGLRRMGFAHPIDSLRRLVHQRYGHIQSSGSSTYHTKNFTMSGIKKLLNQAGFEVAKVDHSNVFFGTPPFYLPFKRGSRLFHLLDRIDCKMADLLPYFLVAGWYFACVARRTK